MLQKETCKILNNQYVVLKEIGVGSFGKIYAGHELNKKSVDQQNSKSNQVLNIVALKKLKTFMYKRYAPKQIVSENDVSQIVEINLLTRFVHVNIIALKQVFIQNQNIYLVLEYCCIDLEIFIKNHSKSITNFDRYFIIKQMLEVLSYLHSNGIIHRDIKPSNFLLTPQGILKLIDYGISKDLQTINLHDQKMNNIDIQVQKSYLNSLDEENEQEQAQAQAQTLMTKNVVTRFYRPPEILFGSQSYDQSVDIWSLGCVIYELCTGEVLFPGESDLDQLGRIFELIGKPDELVWPKCNQLPYYMEYDSNAVNQSGLVQKLQERGVEQALINLIRSMLRLDPLQRIKASEVLQLDFIQNQNINNCEFHHLVLQIDQQKRQAFQDQLNQIIST